MDHVHGDICFVDYLVGINGQSLPTVVQPFSIVDTA